MGMGGARQSAQHLEHPDPQVRARRDAGEAGVQPEGPELVEEETDLQITVPGRVSTGLGRMVAAGPADTQLWHL